MSPLVYFCRWFYVWYDDRYAVYLLSVCNCRTATNIVKNVVDLPKIKVDLAMKKLPVLHWAS
jgi:hypothetical protein